MDTPMCIMTLGVAIAWIGFLVLLFGKRPDVSYSDISMRSGRLYQELDNYFSDRHVLAFKVLSYSGIILVLASVGLMLIDQVPAE